MAVTQVTTDGSTLSVSPWPGVWTLPRHELFTVPARYPRFFTHFDGVGWQPSTEQVVVGVKRTRLDGADGSVYDRWVVTLVERQTGEPTTITPRGVADTSFTVWWPAD